MLSPSLPCPPTTFNPFFMTILETTSTILAVNCLIWSQIFLICRYGSLQLMASGEGHGPRTARRTALLFSTSMTRPFHGAMTVNNDSAFYLGGYLSKDSSPETRDLNGFVPIPGLVEFEFSNGSWSNDTDTRQLTLSGTFMWGALEAVPFGPNGLLVMFGGDTSSRTSYAPGFNPTSMSQVSLHDPVTKKWYKQATSGQIPSSTRRSYTAGVGDDRSVIRNDSIGTYEM